ncbi:helix-turn-helix transcriptional regulator [Pendulispora brunnea]|uniref:Helix-turn-helix transcriptional regulator n=1 Tax=Pendulispora brunnea TaxID=2905690 RepID=A0ABZ2KA28_9BACT
MLQQILDEIPAFAGYKDRQSVFLYANKAYAVLIGLPHSEDVVGRTDFDMPCETVACAPMFQKQDQEVLRSRQPLRILDVHRFADGKWRAFLVTKTPLFGGSSENDEPIGTMFYGVDITSPGIIELGSVLGRIHAGADPKALVGAGSHLVEGFSADTGTLTRREAEILFFLLRGKSAKETAVILSMSRRTVEQHIDKMKQKLGARSKFELIEVAIEAGYMHRIPDSLFSRQLSITLG